LTLDVDATLNTFLLGAGANIPVTEFGPLTNGQLIVGSTGVAPVAAALTAGAGITVTNGAGSITVGLTGGGQAIDSFAVSAGTSPVVPSAAGLITLTDGNAITMTGGTNAITVAVNTSTTTAQGSVELATTAETQDGTYGTTQVVTAGDIDSMMAVPSPIGSTTRNRGDFSRFAVGESSAAFTAITPARIVGTSSETTQVDTSLRLAQTTSGTAAAGYGCSLELQAENSTGSIETQVRISGVWSDATASSEDSFMRITMPIAGVQTNVAEIRPTSYRFNNTSTELTFGSGSPSGSVTAAKGSLYLRTDGSSTSTRAYINTDGGTGWTNITTAA